MSGHSHWSQIKYKKTITDAQKGQLFTKLANAITIAAREGSEPEKNYKLKVAIEKAKEQNMPSENIEKAIKRGTKELEGARIEEATYEGYGPSGIALMINLVTNNKNRSINEIRNILARFGGKLGEKGSVSYLFEQKGIIRIELRGLSKEETELQAIDAGAADFEEEDERLLVYTKPEELFKVKKTLEEKGIKIASASLSREPKSPIKIVEEEKAKQILKLLDALDDCQDVANIYSNFDIPNELIKKIEK